MAKTQTIDVNGLTKDLHIPASTKSTILNFINYTGDYELSGTNDGNNDTALNVASSGNDLTISFVGSEHSEYKIILDNYFAKNGKFPVKTIKIGDESFDLISYVNENYLRGYAQNKDGGVAKSISGTVFDDKLGEGFRNQTINAGVGNDVIFASSASSTLIGGVGTNTMKFDYDDFNNKSFGDDTIKLTKGETLNLNITYTGEPIELSYARGTGSGANDLIITNDVNADDSITLKNYYGKDTGATVLINGKDLSKETDDELFTFDDSHISNTVLTSSALADVIDASDADEQYKTVKKNGKKVQVETPLTINAGAGDDVITGSEYDDVITGGTGVNTIIVNPDLYDSGTFGTDTIVLTPKEGLTVDLTAFGNVFQSANDFQGKFSISGNNLVLTTVEGSLVFKNFAKSNITGDTDTAYVKLKLFNGTLVNLNTDEIFDNAYTPSVNDRKKTATLTGNRFSEKISLNADELDGYTKTINAGNGENTVAVNGSKGKVTINSGSDGDYIRVTGNDALTTVKAGDGENTVIINGGTGSSSVTTGKHMDNINITNSGDATVSSGAEVDTIVTGEGNDTINAGDGDDFITAHKGNDKLTGGKGADTFIFSANDGVDTITDATAEDTISIGSVASNALRYARNGNNLEIFYSDEFDISNKIVVQNHFTKKGKVESRVATTLQVGNEAPINLADVECVISGSGKINGNANDNIIVGSDKADTIKAGAGGDTVYGNGGADTIYGEAGSDEIYGGAGNDKLYGGAGENVFIFEEGDGVDTIYSNGGEDAIQLNKFNSLDDLKAGVTLSSDGSSLKINYSDNDTVIIDKYYTNKTNSVQHIQEKNGNSTSIQDLIDSCDPITVTGSGKITGTKDSDFITGSSKADTIKGLAGDDTIKGLGGNDTINAGLGENRICFSVGDGNDTIQYGGGVDTLVFDDGITVSAKYRKNDLLVTYQGDKGGKTVSNTITIKDYKKTGMQSVQYVQIGEGDVKSIAEYISGGGGGDEGTVINVNDNTYSDDPLVLESGHNNTVKFAVNGEEDYDCYIKSNNTSGYTDTLKMAHTVDSGYMWTPKLQVDGTYGVGYDDWDDDMGTSAYITYYLKPNDDKDSAKLVLADNDTKHDVHVYTEAMTSADFSSSINNQIVLVEVKEEDKKGAISIIGSANDDDIKVENPYVALTYKYTGGNDFVYTQGATDDTYIIASLNDKTSLLVQDNGGEDTLDFSNTTASNVKFVFHVNDDGTYDEERVMAVSNNELTAKNFVSIYNGDIGASIMAYGFNDDSGIEHIKTSDYKTGDGIDADSWYGQIASSVASWLNGKYDSTQDAIDAYAEGEQVDIAGLVAAYSVNYNPPAVS